MASEWAKIAIELTGLAAAAFWVIAAMRNSLSVLGERLGNLAERLHELSVAIKALDDRQRSLETRVGVLEVQHAAVTADRWKE